MYVYEHTWVHTRVHPAARQVKTSTVDVPWSWIYRVFWATRCRCEELNSCHLWEQRVLFSLWNSILPASRYVFIHTFLQWDLYVSHWNDEHSSKDYSSSVSQVFVTDMRMLTLSHIGCHIKQRMAPPGVACDKCREFSFSQKPTRVTLDLDTDKWALQRCQIYTLSLCVAYWRIGHSWWSPIPSWTSFFSVPTLGASASGAKPSLPTLQSSISLCLNTKMPHRLKENNCM